MKRRAFLTGAATMLATRVQAQTKKFILFGTFNALEPPSGFVARYKAYDKTSLTVNSDGSGGLPADGQNFGRWSDISGNGNNLTAAPANAPVFRSGFGVNCQTDPDGIVSGFLANTSFTSIQALNHSGGLSIDLTGSGDIPILDLGNSNIAIDCTLDGFLQIFNGATLTVTSLRVLGRQCVITWRSNAANLIVRVNGQEQTLATPISAAAMTRLHLAVFNGGNPQPCRYYECIIYGTDIGETALIELESYLEENTSPKSGPDRTRTVATVGDSLLYGTGSNILKTAVDAGYISNRISSLWYFFNHGGALMDSPDISAVNLAALKGSNEGVCIIWLGTNDILSGARTGTQTETNLHNYCSVLKAAGCKVIVTTLQAFVPNNAERVIFNNLVSANFTTYADALVNLAAQPNLSDSTNTTYFETDGVHLTDAGYAIAGGLYQTALASI